MTTATEAPSLSQRIRSRAISVFHRVTGRTVARLYHHNLIVRTRNFEEASWLGVPMWQNVLDVWTIQETIAEVRPALLIETGTHKGGSALFYAHLMELLGTGRVVTVDINDIRDQVHERVRFIQGSSTDPAIVAEVQREVDQADGPVMVILDGDHARDHVAQELEIYAPMVTPGSYLLSQDGIIDEFRIFNDTRPGPLPANKAFLDHHPEFSHDAERNDRFGLTHHPVGWLRRDR